MSGIALQVMPKLRRIQIITLLGLVLLGLSSLALAANPPAATPSAATPSASAKLPPDVLRANQEIDEKFLEAHRVPNTDLIMSLFTSSPDVFFVSPNGTIERGHEEIRKSIEKFLAKVITMPGVIDQVTYLPSGDGGVIAYGQVTYHRQLKGQPPDTRVVVWTDYRRKEDGKWVLVFRHAHWPLAGNSLPGAGTTTQAPAER
jgi:ketosteroid isomerase-like protein